jgi:hypothetical protein
VIIGAVRLVGTVNTTFNAITTTFASPSEIEARSPKPLPFFHHHAGAVGAVKSQVSVK